MYLVKDLYIAEIFTVSKNDNLYDYLVIPYSVLVIDSGTFGIYYEAFMGNELRLFDGSELVIDKYYIKKIVPFKYKKCYINKRKLRKFKY